MKLHRLTQMVCCLAAIIVAGCTQQYSRQNANAPREVVFVVSPFNDALPNHILELVKWSAHQGDCHVRAFDGWEGVQITDYTVPRVDYFKEEAVLRRVGMPLQDWMKWSREIRTNSPLKNSGALNVPKVLARLAQEHSSPEYLIFLGSPVARFPGSTNYDFAHPSLRYPADGQIELDSASPFFSKGMEHSLNGTKVLFLYPGADTAQWPAAYEARLHHFYGRFFGSRAANLAAFTPDHHSALKMVNSSAKLPFNDFKAETPNVVQMIDARTIAIPVSQTITSFSLAASSPTTNLQKRVALVATNQIVATNSSTPATPALAKGMTTSPVRSTNTPPPGDNTPKRPASVTGSPESFTSVAQPLTRTNFIVVSLPKSGVTLQLRYPGNLNADLDLYLRPHSDAQEVSFRNESTSLATYEYSFDLVSGEHVKSVNVPSGCDAEKAIAWVNYRRGFGSATCRILWITPSGSRETRIALLTQKGGDGDSRRDYFRKRSDCWLRVNLLDLATSSPKSGIPASDSDANANRIDFRREGATR